MKLREVKPGVVEEVYDLELNRENLDTLLTILDNFVSIEPDLEVAYRILFMDILEQTKSLGIQR